MHTRHHKLYRVALIAAALLLALTAMPGLSTTPAEAGGTWSAWLYSYDRGELVQVFPDGAPANTFTFPLPPGVTEYPSDVMLSRDGTRVAACHTDTSGNARVDVYDLVNNMFIGQYLAGGPAAGCALTRYAFSEDGSLLAFGMLYHYPGQSGDSRPQWELLVLEMNTNNIVARLSSDSPLLGSLPIDFNGKMPLVSTFQMPTANSTGLISFKPVQWGTEGMCEYPAVVWDLGQNTVYQGQLAGKNSLSLLLNTSEATWIGTDESLPQGTLMGPGCTHNVVMYSNKSGNRWVLYHDGTVLWSAAFVNNGRHIALLSYANNAQNWISIDRSGNTAPLPADIDSFRVWGTVDGYVFLNAARGSGGTPEVRYHRYDSAGQVQAFSAWTGPANSSWQIVTVTPPLGGEMGLQPFPPLLQTGQPPQMPTATPAQPGQLTLNSTALVNTTEGDFLNVRTGPGVSFAVAFDLSNGTPVTLVEGPVSAEGYTWWRVQTNDGRAGWAVEGVQDPDEGFIQTLVPAAP